MPSQEAKAYFSKRSMVLPFKPRRACKPEAKRSAQVHKLFQAKLFKVATAMAQARARDKRWADRLASGLQARLGLNGSTLLRLLKYALASWLGILIQYALTLWLSRHMHYLLANVLSIVVASVSNYLTNDWWTFRRHKAPEA